MARPIGTFCGNLAIAATSSFVVLGFVSFFQSKEKETELPNNIKEKFTTADPQKISQGARILKYGAPERGENVYFHANHVLGYNQAKRIPDWVAEHITGDHLKGSATRKKSNFKEDLQIVDIFRSSNSDYKNSGWSRGHMAPAADSKYSQIAMDETFLLSNIVPQDINNNQHFWNRFEIYCRSLTQTFHDVRVISGPLFIPTVEENGKLFIKYEVIGVNQVAVPTHLYKIVVIENTFDKMVAVGAFIVPNQPITGSDLANYQVSLDDLEKKSGLKFLPMLNLSKTKNLCSVVSCKLMGGKELELMFIRKKLESAYNLDELEKVWKEMKRKKISPEKAEYEIYERKKAELMR
ncbi:nuclease EXOG, mitochondrial-like [Antedon mediterranea]|uniref:nuclease EXOG, mitochondrial-like n=1 Tax=Antedon mediterranea TaxID=105859 RepID=UPI003AF6BBE4